MILWHLVLIYYDLLLTLVHLRMCHLSLTDNGEDCLCLVCHPSQTKAGVTFLQFAFGCRLVDFGTSLHLLQYEYYDCHTLGVAST